LDVEARYLIAAYSDELAQAMQRIAVLSALVKQLTDARMADQLAQAQAAEDTKEPHAEE
jgi:mannitol/fructose-specific phosphotransferase system IIA component